MFLKSYVVASSQAFQKALTPTTTLKKSLPIIAIGPNGGKIVGYAKGKPVYQGSAAAAKLEAAKAKLEAAKAKHDAAKGAAAGGAGDTLKQVVDAVSEWLHALGLTPTASTGDTFALTPADAAEVQKVFGVKGTPLGGHVAYTAQQFAAHVGKPLTPSAQEALGVKAAMAAGVFGDDSPFTSQQLSSWKVAGSAGGSHGHTFVVKDQSGKSVAIWKTHDAKIMRAEEAAARLAQLVFPKPQLYSKGEVVTLGGQQGVLLTKLEGTHELGPESGHKIADTDLQKHAVRLIQHQVFGWLTDNHDTHGGNFLVTADGDVAAYDAGQAWRFVAETGAKKPKLVGDLTYNPNGKTYGLASTQVWTRWKEGKLKLDKAEVISAVEEVLGGVAKLSAEQYEQIVAPYFATRADGATAIKLAVERFQNMRSDWEAFLTKQFGEKITLTPKTKGVEAAPALTIVEPGENNFATMPEQVAAATPGKKKPPKKTPVAAASKKLNTTQDYADAPVGTKVVSEEYGWVKVAPGVWDAGDGQTHSDMEMTGGPPATVVAEFGPEHTKGAAAKPAAAPAPIAAEPAPAPAPAPAEPPKTIQLPGWPLKKGKVTVHHPGAPAKPTPWPANYPGPGYKADIDYKGKLYTFEFGQTLGGKPSVIVTDVASGKVLKTNASIQEAADVPTLVEKGLSLDLSSADKKKLKIGYSATKLFALDKFAEEFSAVSTVSPTVGSEPVAVLEEQKVVAHETKALNAYDTLFAHLGSDDGVITDMALLPFEVQESVKAFQTAFPEVPHDWVGVPPGTVFAVAAEFAGTKKFNLYVAGMSAEEQPVWKKWEVWADDDTGASVQSLGTVAGLGLASAALASNPALKDVVEAMKKPAPAPVVAAAPVAEPEPAPPTPTVIEVPPSAPKTFAGPLAPGTTITKTVSTTKKGLGTVKLTVDEVDGKQSFSVQIGTASPAKFGSLSAACDHVWVVQQGYANAAEWKAKNGSKVPSGGGWKFWGLKSAADLVAVDTEAPAAPASPPPATTAAPSAPGENNFETMPDTPTVSGPSGTWSGKTATTISDLAQLPVGSVISQMSGGQLSGPDTNHTLTKVSSSSWVSGKGKTYDAGDIVLTADTPPADAYAVVKVGGAALGPSADELSATLAALKAAPTGAKAVDQVHGLTFEKTSSGGWVTQSATGTAMTFASDELVEVTPAGDLNFGSGKFDIHPPAVPAQVSANAPGKPVKIVEALEDVPAPVQDVVKAMWSGVMSNWGDVEKKKSPLWPAWVPPPGKFIEVDIPGQKKLWMTTTSSGFTPEGEACLPLKMVAVDEQGVVYNGTKQTGAAGLHFMSVLENAGVPASVADDYLDTLKNDLAFPAGSAMTTADAPPVSTVVSPDTQPEEVPASEAKKLVTKKLTLAEVIASDAVKAKYGFPTGEWGFYASEAHSGGKYLQVKPPKGSTVDWVAKLKQFLDDHGIKPVSGPLKSKFNSGAYAVLSKDALEAETTAEITVEEAVSVPEPVAPPKWPMDGVLLESEASLVQAPEGTSVVLGNTGVKFLKNQIGWSIIGVGGSVAQPATGPGDAKSLADALSFGAMDCHVYDASGKLIATVPKKAVTVPPPTASSAPVVGSTVYTTSAVVADAPVGTVLESTSSGVSYTKKSDGKWVSDFGGTYSATDMADNAPHVVKVWNASSPAKTTTSAPAVGSSVAATLEVITSAPVGTVLAAGGYTYTKTGVDKWSSTSGLTVGNGGMADGGPHTVQVWPDGGGSPAAATPAIGTVVTGEKWASTLGAAPVGTEVTSPNGFVYTKLPSGQWQSVSGNKYGDSDFLTSSGSFTISSWGGQSAPAKTPVPTGTGLKALTLGTVSYYSPASKKLALELHVLGEGSKITDGDVVWTKNASGMWATDDGSAKGLTEMSSTGKQLHVVKELWHALPPKWLKSATKTVLKENFLKTPVGSTLTFKDGTVWTFVDGGDTAAVKVQLGPGGPAYAANGNLVVDAFKQKGSAVFALPGPKSPEQIAAEKAAEEKAAAKKAAAEKAAAEAQAKAKAKAAAAKAAAAEAKAKAKVITDWKAANPAVTSSTDASGKKTLKALSFFQNDAKMKTKKLWAHTAGGATLLGSPDFDALKESVDNWTGFPPYTEVDTPLGKMLSVDTASFQKLFPTDTIQGPDGKEYPAGTTFQTEKVVTKTKLHALKGEPGHHTVAADKSGAQDSTALKWKYPEGSSAPGAKEKAVASLAKYGITPTAVLVGSANIITTVPTSVLNEGVEFADKVTAKTPPQPAPFTQAPPPPGLGLPAGAPGSIASVNEGDIDAFDAIKPSVLGHTVRTGGAKLWRNHQIAMRKVVDSDGKEYVEIVGDLLMWEKAQEAGLTSKTVSLPHLKYDADTGKHSPSGEGSTYNGSGYTATLDSGTTVSVLSGGSDFVMQGSTVIRVPAGADVRSEMVAALKKLGIPDDVASSQHDDDAERVFIKAQIVRAHLGSKGWGNYGSLTGFGGKAQHYITDYSGTKVPIEKMGDEVWLDTQLAAFNAHDLVDTAVIKTTIGGRHAVWLDVPPDDVLETNVRFLQSGQSVEVMKSTIFEQGGQPSLKKRVLMGVSKPGGNAGSDLHHGGDGSMFRTVGMTEGGSPFGNCSGKGFGGCRMIAHPRVLKRADHRIHYSDWGEHSKDNTPPNTSAALASTTKKMQNGGFNETLHEDGIGTEDIAGVWCTSEWQRTELLNEAAKRGMTHINEIPVEKFFFTCPETHAAIQNACEGLKPGVLP